MQHLSMDDPKALMAEHLASLRGYAVRVLLQGESLDPTEEAEWSGQMQEYLAVGDSFKLTRRELVALLYEGLLNERRTCGCHSCRARFTSATT